MDVGGAVNAISVSPHDAFVAVGGRDGELHARAAVRVRCSCPQAALPAY